MLVKSVVGAFFLGLSPSGFAAKQLVHPEKIQQSYRHHAVLAQLYRWYLPYENEQYPLQNQLDILADDIVIRSSQGAVRGHQQYVQTVQALPSHWKNAHIVKRTHIKLGRKGMIQLSVDAKYLNLGALPNQAVKTSDLRYSILLRKADDRQVLPKLSEVAISTIKSSETDQFHSSYVENRMRSLVHFWLAQVENPAPNSEAFREVLDTQFALNFPSGVIRDFAQFEHWLNHSADQVDASMHTIKKFSVTDLGENTYRIYMDLTWSGIKPDQTQLRAKTRHVWDVLDNPVWRFAKIQNLSADLIEPFTPVTNGAK